MPETTPDTATAPATTPAVDLNPLLAKLDELKVGLAARPAAPPAPAPAAPAAPTRVTQQQLAELVNAQKISYADALELWGEQIKRDAEEALDAKLNARLAAVKTEGRLESSAATLLRDNPDLGVTGSELWKSAVAEYNQLVAEGHEQGPKTQLLAARMAVKAAGAPVTPIIETTRERTVSTETSTPSPARKPTGPRKLSNKERIESIEDRHVRHFLSARMAEGRYKGYDDPKLTKYLDSVFARAQKFGRGAA